MANPIPLSKTAELFEERTETHIWGILRLFGFRTLADFGLRQCLIFVLCASYLVI